MPSPQKFAFIYFMAANTCSGINPNWATDGCACARSTLLWLIPQLIKGEKVSFSITGAPHVEVHFSPAKGTLTGYILHLRVTRWIIFATFFTAKSYSNFHSRRYC